jgi:hypothetical protein
MLSGLTQKLPKSLIYRTALLYLEAAQRASTGSPPCLPLREAAARLRDGNRLFGGLVSPRRQERQEFVDCA